MFSLNWGGAYRNCTKKTPYEAFVSSLSFSSSSGFEVELAAKGYDSVPLRVHKVLFPRKRGGRSIAATNYLTLPLDLLLLLFLRWEEYGDYSRNIIIIIIIIIIINIVTYHITFTQFNQSF